MPPFTGASAVSGNAGVGLPTTAVVGMAESSRSVTLCRPAGLGKLQLYCWVIAAGSAAAVPASKPTTAVPAIPSATAAPHAFPVFILVPP